jgi:toxin HigB-1
LNGARSALRRKNAAVQAVFPQTLSRKLRLQLAALQSANQIEDLECPGYRLHLLKGADKGRWSIWVNSNWRLTFEFREGHIFNLDFEDYH